jgi:site-specific recombinase XerD
MVLNRTKLIEYLTFKNTKVKPFISRKQQRSKTEQAEYIKNGKQYDVNLTDVQPVFAEEFYLYLTVDRTIKLKNAAANKQIKNTKQVFTYAVTKGKLQVNPLAYYRTGDGDSEVIPLTDAEVESIVNATGLTERVERIRDCFVVQIYTGFAFQDLKALTLENIYKEPATGVYFLCRQRGKTGIDEMVPIMPMVKQMIDKYALDPECQAKGVLFPVPSNTCYNQYLKELQDHCKIIVKITTHLGRHTFAHRMLNLYGFSLSIVSRMLGHKSIRTTEHYCKVSIRLIAEAFAPELAIQRPKPAIIRSIETSYCQLEVAA